MQIHGTSEISTCAARFIAELKPQQDIATIITLSGELGAGKTTFAQGVARALGVEETVTSPTFVIEKVYELPEGNVGGQTSNRWQRLIHIDAYRLKSSHELEVLGWHEMAAERGNLIIIDEIQRAPALFPILRVLIDDKKKKTAVSYTR